jgi:hypothetical protein
MNKSQDEIVKRISQMHRAAAATVAIATGHPGLGAAVAAIPQPNPWEAAVNNN